MQHLSPATHPGSKINYKPHISLGSQLASTPIGGTILLSLISVIWSRKHKQITLQAFIIQGFMLVELILSNF